MLHLTLANLRAGPIRSLATFLSVLIGMVASLVPAWRAARIDVLDAIATE